MTTTYERDTQAFTTLRQRLEDDRTTLLSRLAVSNDENYELTATHGHGETELAARTGQKDIDSALRADATAALDAVNDALDRFGAGSYGHCVSCNEAIPAERLLAIPEAARCIGCQQRFDREL